MQGLSQRLPLRLAARAAMVWALFGFLGAAGPAAAQEAEPQQGGAIVEEPQPPAPPAEEAAGEEGAAEAAAPAVPEPERIEFTLPLPEDQGGGSVSGKAGSFEYETDKIAVLSGGVELLYQDLKLQAQEIRLDLETNTVTALGDVIMDQGPRRLTGDTAEIQLDTKTGGLTNATAFVDPDYYFSGAQITRTGENTFVVDEGVFTSCSEEVPDWSFRLKHAEITVGGYARIRSASMRVKKAPVIYFPYILWPAKTERASGFLVPQPGYSQERGASVGLAYYQTLGRSFDTTFFADLYSKEYYGLGNELRYQPSEGTKGQFEGFAIYDPTTEDWRWRVNYDHDTRDLPFGLRGVLTYRDFSDFDYYRDFERDFSRNSLRSLTSRGFLTGNWGQHSLNVLVDDRETLISGTDTIQQRRLPEIEYRLRPSRLGKLPLYLEVDSSLAYLDLRRSATYDGSYGRFDLEPNLKLPIRAWPWLSVSLNVGQRYTWYGDSLCQVGGTGDDACPVTGQQFTGESLSREQTTAGLEVVGPSFSRIFDRKPGGRWAKLKHVIEPRFDWGYSSELEDDEIGRIPLFDEIDRLSSNRLGRVTLVNRLLAKPADEKKGGSAREILSLEVSQAYSFDDDQPLERSRDGSVTSDRGPLTSRLRYNPGGGTSLKAEVRYSTLFSNLSSTSLSGSYSFKGNNTLGLTWFTRYQPELGETASDQVRVWSTLNLIPKRLQLQAQLNYDLEMSLLQQQRYLVSYNSQCFSWMLEGREYRVGERTDRDYRLAISLKNVGTFLDMSGRQGAGTR